MELKLRKHFFPRAPVSRGAFLFITCIIPLVYWFELFVVLPALYEMWTLHYWVHFVVGHFLMLNVTGSYIGLVVIDNSVKRHVIHKDIQPDWRLCDECKIQVPPRSWHCAACNACILKRDHHCFFTGYCIGHHNHRLFMMFLFYTLISCVYATFYNCYFLGEQMALSKWVLRAIFSVPLLLSGQNIDITHLYLLLFQIIIGGLIFLLVLFVYHIQLIVHGWVGHEKKYSISKFDMGTKQNFINVFGERWYICWLSPFISSRLPSNGFCWDVNPTQTKKL